LKFIGGPLKENVYQLEQFHCHWFSKFVIYSIARYIFKSEIISSCRGTDDNVGSEHTVDGEAFAAEVSVICIY
jgi:hypothetical protein